jgi:glucose uptake protein GlcU
MWCSILGEEMPKGKKTAKKTEGSNAVYWIAMILIGVLLLKGFGILKTLFNVDPDGITLNVDIGYITSAVLFGIVLARLHSINDNLNKVVSSQGERIARIEGVLENQAKKP